MDSYIETLIQEAEIRIREFTEPVSTVYIGGGTPSLLSPDQLSRLILGLSRVVSLSDVSEFSIEANPGTLNDAFLLRAANLGINRVSLGMQAYQEKLLKLLGRIHSFPDVCRSAELIQKRIGENFNLDLIFGIPGQTMADWNETLSAAISLRPKHISAYGLIPEEGTPLFDHLKNKDYELPDQDLEREMYDLTLKKLQESGYLQYEISNFAKPGFACCHNIGYWQQVPYIGLGLSAASMSVCGHDASGLTCVRKTNPADPDVYREMVLNRNWSAAEMEIVSPRETQFETMMLSLRMNRGIRPERFLELHGISIEQRYGKPLAEMESKGLMKFVDGAWSLTRKGMDIQNSILLEFMDGPA